jgi:predicted transcriptional regulator
MENAGSSVTDDLTLLALTGRIVAAYVSHNPVSSDRLPALLQEVYAALSSLADGGGPVAARAEPAVPVAKSVTGAHIICLEDGKKLKMLKRYLRTHFDMSPQEYRSKWGLPASYPMIAPDYAKQRSQLAKDIGLGRIPAAKKKPARKAPVKRKRKTAAPAR